MKDKLQQVLHVPPSNQRLYTGPLILTSKELPNHRTLHDAGVYQSGDTLLLDIVGTTTETTPSPMMSPMASASPLIDPITTDIRVSSQFLPNTPNSLLKLIELAKRGLTLGLKPNLSLEGSGGTYLLPSPLKNSVLVFKPGDEEPYAVNNPRGYTSALKGETALREGIQPGESCVREVAAWFLDHDGFAGVPMTTLAEVRHESFHYGKKGPRWVATEDAEGRGWEVAEDCLKMKLGSCQEFVNAECSMDDMSESKISVDEVHKIAILDIRIMNADRNAANLLVRRRPDNELELVPIDHGYCLRSAADVAWFDWCWMDWPQLKKPLSKKNKDYILNLDIEADARVLQEDLGIGKEAVDYFRASSTLLQAGVKAGMTLHEIAVICSRQDGAGTEPSKLEKMHSQAMELSTAATRNGRWHHTAASKALANQITTVPMLPQLSRANRTQSSCDFLALLSQSDTVTTFTPTPGRAPVSRSDSSSDSDPTLEEDDCDEWAATILSNVQLVDESRHRSPSIASSSSGSMSFSGHLGFWVVRPGADPDDDTWESSTGAVSDDNLDVVVPEPSSRRISSLTLGDKTESLKTIEFDLSPMDQPPEVNTSVRGLFRSQSFAAFSFPSEGLCPSKLSSFSRSSSADSGQQNLYFYKFIDLLIQQETTHATKIKS